MSIISTQKLILQPEKRNLL